MAVLQNGQSLKEAWINGYSVIQIVRNGATAFIVDKSLLEQEIAISNTFSNDTGRYTTESWDPFAAARTSAMTVFNSTKATQAQVDSAKSTLETARGNLIVRVYIGTFTAPISNLYFGKKIYGELYGGVPGPYTFYQKGSSANIPAGYQYAGGAEWQRWWFKGFFTADLTGAPNVSQITECTINFGQVSSNGMAYVGRLANTGYAGDANPYLRTASDHAVAINGTPFDYTTAIKEIITNYGKTTHGFIVYKAENLTDLRQDFASPTIAITYTYTV